MFEMLTLAGVLNYGPVFIMSLAIVWLYLSLRSFRVLLEQKLDQLIESLKDMKDNVTPRGVCEARHGELDRRNDEQDRRLNRIEEKIHAA